MPHISPHRRAGAAVAGRTAARAGSTQPHRGPVLGPVPRERPEQSLIPWAGGTGKELQPLHPTRPQQCSARPEAAQRQTPSAPRARVVLQPRSVCSSVCSASGEVGLRCWDQDCRKEVPPREHKEGFLEEVMQEGLLGGVSEWRSRSWQDRERNGCLKWGAGPGLRGQGQARWFSGSLGSVAAGAEVQVIPVGPFGAPGSSPPSTSDLPVSLRNPPGQRPPARLRCPQVVPGQRPPAHLPRHQLLRGHLWAAFGSQQVGLRLLAEAQRLPLKYILVKKRH